MTFTLTHSLVLLLSYLVGSIPFGLVIARIGGKGDVRKIGSGNIGATNVLRTGSKGLAFLTLFFDLFKGWCAVYAGKHYGLASWAAIAVVVGHMFPIWLKFRGGKGVATYAGVLLGLSVPLGLQAVLAWISFLVIFGYSSLAALLATLLVPFTVWFWHYTGLLEVTLVLTILVWLKHHANIQRLLKGEEPKVGKRNKNKEEKPKKA